MPPIAVYESSGFADVRMLFVQQRGIDQQTCRVDSRPHRSVDQRARELWQHPHMPHSGHPYMPPSARSRTTGSVEIRSLDSLQQTACRLSRLALRLGSCGPAGEGPNVMRPTPS
jgi:hypothetical protein